MTFKDEAISFIEKMQKLYLEDRDMATLLTYFDEDCTWIGTGKEEVSFGMSETKEHMFLELVGYTEGFVITDSTYHAIDAGENAVVVFGELYAESKDKRVGDLNYRLSATVTKQGDSIRLRHVHVSSPEGKLAPGAFYAKRGKSDDYAASKENLQKTLRAIRQKDIKMAELMRNIPGASHQCMVDRYLTLINMSDSFLTMTGYTAAEISEIFNNRFIDMVFPEDRAPIAEAINAQLFAGDVIEIEYRIQRKDGTCVWVLDKGKRTITKDGTATFYCIILDISKQREEREELRLSLERHKIIMAQTNDILFEWNLVTDCLTFSSNWRARFGYEAIDTEVSRKMRMTKNIYHEDIFKMQSFMQDMEKGIAFSEIEIRICDVLGNYIWHRIRATTQKDSLGKTIKAVGIIIDIDVEKRKTDNLVKMSQKDSLTGLLNKITTQEVTQEILKNADQGTMLVMDIDDFKNVNDTFGHLCGDNILTEFAEILKKNFRSTDVIGRIGGDEFLLFLPGINVSKTQELVEALLFDVSNIAVEEKNIVSSSIGSAFFPGDGKSFLELYKAADTALYHAKRRGKGTYISHEASKCVDPDTCEPDGIGANSPIDSDEFNINEQTAQHCFRVLYGADNTNDAIKNLLEILGRLCEASRVYIFENSEDNSMCSNTFEWCADGIDKQKSKLQNLSFSRDVPGYLDMYNGRGFLYCTDINELGSELAAMLRAQSIKAILHCAIIDGGEVRGYIGFDDCITNRIWTKDQIKALSFATEIIGTFLLKQRYKEKLHKLTEKRGKDE